MLCARRGGRRSGGVVMGRTVGTLAAVAVVLALGLAVSGASCKPKAKPAGGGTGGSSEATAPIVVGAPDGVEGEVLGAIVMRLLKAEGIEASAVEPYRRAEDVANAVRDGRVTAFVAHSAFSGGLTVVAMTTAHSGEVICTSKDVSDLYMLRSLDDFASYAKGGGDVRLACSERFASVAAGLKALQEAYGLALGPDQIDARSDTTTPAAVADLAAGRVTFAVASGTDPAIDDLGLVILDDPRSFAETGAPVLVVKDEVLAAHPQLADAFDAAFAGLTTEVLRGLNRRVAYGGESADAVAEEYLSGGGYLK
ncbi:MAG: hypothetical protein FDZ70_02250 [Actinobacteria bacterium]|nr:MAG: hypothetical protein FDZ70_02250 [Actinomycetota bacterium]